MTPLWWKKTSAVENGQSSPQQPSASAESSPSASPFHELFCFWAFSGKGRMCRGEQHRSGSCVWASSSCLDGKDGTICEGPFRRNDKMGKWMNAVFRALFSIYGDVGCFVNFWSFVSDSHPCSCWLQGSRNMYIMRPIQMLTETWEWPIGRGKWPSNPHNLHGLC